jgi:hypothetical protein
MDKIRQRLEAVADELQKLSLSSKPNPKKKAFLLDKNRRLHIKLHIKLHENTPTKPYIPWRTIFVQSEQVSQNEINDLMRQGMSLKVDILRWLKEWTGKLTVSGRKSRIAIFEVFRSELIDIMGFQIDSEVAETMLYLGDVLQRYIEAHLKFDDGHLKILIQRISYFLKGKYAFVLFAAVEQFLPKEYFQLFIHHIDEHPTARRTAIKPTAIKPKVAEAGSAKGGACLD